MLKSWRMSVGSFSALLYIICANSRATVPPLRTSLRTRHQRALGCCVVLDMSKRSQSPRTLTPGADIC